MENWQNYSGCKALSDEQIDRIAASFYGKYRLRDRAIFLTGVYTGFRISEILSLDYGDLVEGSFIRNAVTVKKAYMKGKKESRTMPPHFRARSAISELINSLSGEYRLEKLPLFRSQGTEKRLTSRMFAIVLKQAAQTAGISCQKLATHSMRKTFCSRLWSSPLISHDLAKLALLMGHRNPANTLRYIQFLDNSLSEAVLAV